MNLREAEIRIGEVLRELELSTGSLVECVDIVDIDVTNIESVRQELQAKVQIKLKLIPGRRW